MLFQAPTELRAGEEPFRQTKIGREPAQGLFSRREPRRREDFELLHSRRTPARLRRCDFHCETGLRGSSATFSGCQRRPDAARARFGAAQRGPRKFGADSAPPPRLCAPSGEPRRKIEAPCWRIEDIATEGAKGALPGPVAKPDSGIADLAESAPKHAALVKIFLRFVL